MLSKRRLAAARRAEQHHELALAQREVDPTQGDHVDLAHAVDFPEVARLDDRVLALLGGSERARRTASSPPEPAEHGPPLAGSGRGDHCG
jgi:hypothetical protein